MAQIEWSFIAENDLNEIIDYIVIKGARQNNLKNIGYKLNTFSFFYVLL